MLLELFAERDRLDARIVEAVAAFDAASLWDVEAATSMVAWLRDRARLSGVEAQRLVNLARRLRSLPAVRRAWACGSLSKAQVETITSTVGHDTELFDEDELVPLLAPLSVADTAAVMRDWRVRGDAIKKHRDPDTDVVEPASTLQLSPVGDRGRLDADLDRADHVVVEAALRVADSGDLSVSPAERRADALVDVCQFFLDNQQTERGGRHRPHVNLVVDIDRIDSIVERYLCDCTIHRVITDGRSAILDVGTATRVLTAAMWTALKLRDRHCRFPGCDRPATWCDGHHIWWVSHGGPTRLDNLVLLCRRHHKRLHQPGWHAKLLPDGQFEITTPTGEVRTSDPPGNLPRLC